MATDLAGKRIMLVEDEYFIASDLSRALRAEQAVVIGPVSGIDSALLLLEDEAVDAAVLDVNLEGVSSYPLADELVRRGVPFMFLTGYDGWALPEAYRGIPRLTKPAPIAAVLDCVGRLATTGAEA